MRNFLLFLLAGSLFVACEADEQLPNVYTPAQLRGLLVGQDSSAWFMPEVNPPDCQPFDRLLFLPDPEASGRLLALSYFRAACDSLDTLYVSFPVEIGARTTNQIRFYTQEDSVQSTIRLLTSQRLELEGTFLPGQESREWAYVRD